MDVMQEIEDRITIAEGRYGPFASTHEAMGVAMEEWDEFREAVRSNDLLGVYAECLDLAAVLIRFAHTVSTNEDTKNRSVK